VGLPDLSPEVHVRKPPSSEWLLARIAGPDRAAAILGDLVEMSESRGRLWFWTAYARTLFSLTWRIPVALLGAVVCRELIFDLFHLYMHYTPASWRTTLSPPFLNSMGPLLACIMSTLWFALPFAAVRYGVRDRFVQLTFAVAIGTTVAFLFIPWASLFCAAATLALAGAALISTSWRKPLEVLIWSGAAGLLTIAAVDAVRINYHPAGHAGRIIVRYGVIMAFQASLLVLAVVCSRLHRLLLRQQPSGGSTLA
jgi:hypothetical protein